MRFERFFRIPLILHYFVLLHDFNLRTLCADGRVKLGQELTESTYGNCANLALRCCNVPVPVTTSQEAVCTSLVAAVMADAADTTHSVLPKLVR
jgi:hypothetical protein